MTNRYWLKEAFNDSNGDAHTVGQLAHLLAQLLSFEAIVRGRMQSLAPERQSSPASTKEVST